MSQREKHLITEQEAKDRKEAFASKIIIIDEAFGLFEKRQKESEAKRTKESRRIKNVPRK